MCGACLHWSVIALSETRQSMCRTAHEPATHCTRLPNVPRRASPLSPLPFPLSPFLSPLPQVFGVAFSTPAVDSQGKAHVIEHGVLEGSQHYPVKVCASNGCSGSWRCDSGVRLPPVNHP